MYYYSGYYERSERQIIDLIRDQNKSPTETNKLIEAARHASAALKDLGFPSFLLSATECNNTTSTAFPFLLNTYIFRIAEQTKRHDYMASRERDVSPYFKNPAMVRAIKARALDGPDATPISIKAVNFVNDEDLPILFGQKLPKKTIAAYNWRQGIILRPNDPEIVTSFVHEARHAWRQHDFPQLFEPPGGDVRQLKIDFFVARKLSEFDAYLTSDAHDHFHAHRMRNILKMLGVERPKSDQKRAIEVFTPEFFMGTSARLNLSSYEKGFVADLLPIIKAGEFELRLSQSALLEKPFLMKFLARPDAIPYPPESVDRLCNDLIKFVSTLKHQELVRALGANEATQRRGNVSMRPEFDCRQQNSLGRTTASDPAP